MKQFYLTLALLATFFFAIPHSYACSVLFDKRPLNMRMNDYDTVFIGKVQEVKYKEGTGDTDAKFLVIATVKGAPKPDDKVDVISHMGSCSHRFNKDEIWLITTNGKSEPYSASMGDASGIIHEGRGLPVMGWAAVKPLLDPEVFAKMAEKDKCIGAMQTLTEHFEKLDRKCTTDQDCQGFFISPFPCQRAIIANRHAMQPDVTKALEGIQVATRVACPIKMELIPACEAPAINAVCDGGVCKDRSEMPMPDPIP